MIPRSNFELFLVKEVYTNLRISVNSCKHEGTFCNGFHDHFCQHVVEGRCAPSTSNAFHTFPESASTIGGVLPAGSNGIFF